jgi:uncharacterized membrane protein YkoI
MEHPYAIPKFKRQTAPRQMQSISVMRIFALFALFAASIAAFPADAQRPHARAAHQRDQDAVYHGRQQGDILPLPVILSRVHVRGAQFIGADLDGQVYRLTFMRGADVIRVHVDARTGRTLGYTR